jgi:hypothetical protein
VEGPPALQTIHTFLVDCARGGGRKIENGDKYCRLASQLLCLDEVSLAVKIDEISGSHVDEREDGLSSGVLHRVVW